MKYQNWRAYQQGLLKRRDKGKRLLFSLLFLVSGMVFLGWFSSRGFSGDPSALQAPDEGTSKLAMADSREGEGEDPLVLEDSGIRFRATFQPRFEEVQNGRFVSHLSNGMRITYTLDISLQERMERVMANYRLPYGMFVAVEPKTGRVLAMVDYSNAERSHGNLNLKASYPAASIFKLVTAAAALESGKVTPETRIAYHGGLWRLGPRNWRDDLRRDREVISLTDALAKSCNVAFAKVALRWLGDEGLHAYAGSFWFNKPIRFEFPVEVSRATIGPDEASIAYSAAGMGEVGLSPLHGAMIASAIANDGVMMVPKIVEGVISGSGEEVYRLKEETLTRVVSVQTAEQLRGMMAYTILKGTSHRAFYSRRGKPYIKGIPIGGKTGSLTGDDPQGKYSWFVGIAPLDNPEIALAALVINQPKWRIKASHLAKEAFDTFFKSEEIRTAVGN